MALLKLSAKEALENRKLPSASWGRRGETNRVEPITLPLFDVPFQLVPGEPIFTIGSCFARHVEAALRSRGFQVPARQLFEQDAFRAMNPGIMNNFGVASIANEFGWALDPATPYDFDRNIVEVGTDRWVDLHIVPSERPRPRDEVLALRNAIIEVTRAVRDCRVVVMTLGLNEVWYDLDQDLYLNTAPMPRVLARFPDRFELHVLDFEQTLGFMQHAVDLLRTHCRPDQQVMLTVSPVPLSNTMRRDDVIVANSYSKACLRTVAEHVCLQNDNVTYYPSYESVTMTDRAIAWEDDLVHVTRAIVDVNVNRMVTAFVPGTDLEAMLEESAAEGEFLGLENEAVRLSGGDATEGTRFFDRFAGYGQYSPRLAELAAQHFLRVRNADAARQQIDWLPPSDGSYGRALLEARTLHAEGNHAQAVALLRPLVADNPKHPPAFWLTLVRSLAGMGDAAGARAAAHEWIKLVPRRRTDALVALAQALTPLDAEAAINAYRAAIVDLGQPGWAVRKGLVEALIAAGRRAEAAEELGQMEPQTYSEQETHNRLAAIMQS